jgi:hypothetical protein
MIWTGYDLIIYFIFITDVVDLVLHKAQMPLSYRPGSTNILQTMPLKSLMCCNSVRHDFPAMLT